MLFLVLVTRRSLNKMELKRYVLTTDGYIYKKKQVKQHKDTNTTHIVSFGIVSYHLINIKKTSDNILDLVEVGDLVEKDNDWEILKVMRISKNGNAVCSVRTSSNNEEYEINEYRKSMITSIYKRQSNGDYKRHKVKE